MGNRDLFAPRDLIQDERAGRTPAAVRARLEKEGGLDRIRAGIRREKTMTWILEKAQIVTG